MRQRGFILMSTVIVTAFLITLVILIAQLSMNHFASAKRNYYSVQASSAAEAGVEKFMLEINQDRNHTGSGGEVTLYEDSRGKTSYQTTVANGSLSNEKVITATGRYYLPGRSSAFLTRKLKVIIRGLNPFKYGLQTGIGPLYLYGNTGLNGEVFTNSRILIQDNTVDLQGTIKAAGRNTANDCSIEGNGDIPDSIINVAYKVCLPTPGSTVTQYDSTITPQTLPGVDKNTILGNITSTASCASVNTAPYRLAQAHYPNTGSGTSGGCNVSLSANQTYTLEGDVHIRGNLTADRNVFKVSENLSRDIYVLVEGRINISGNGSSVIPNNASYGVTFVSYDPTNSNGDKNSADAIEISGNSLSLNARFLNETGSFGLTGRGLIGQVAAASIVLNGSGSMTFVTNDPDAEDEGGNIWNVIYYQPVFD